MNEMLERKALQRREDYERFNPRPAIDAAAEQAIMVWNALGGEIDFTQLPWLIEQYDVTDTNALHHLLLVIRETNREKVL